MIECPKCRSLNSDDSKICGSCGTDLSNLKRKTKVKSSGEVHLKNSNNINKTVRQEYKKMEEQRIKKEGIVLFIISLLCWLFIAIPGVKFFVAFLILVLANFSEDKESIFLTLAKVICILQIIGLFALAVITLLNT